MSNRGRELFELTRVRVLLFLREPEAIFWVFFFPLVLAAVLGFAFRSRGVEPARIGLVEAPASAPLCEALARDPHIELVRYATRAEGQKKLERAALDVLLEPGADPLAPTLAFDPQRPESENGRVRVLRALELARSGGARSEEQTSELQSPC